MSDITFNNVSSSDPTDIESNAIVVTNVNTEFGQPLSITDISYQNSSISLVSFNSFINFAFAPKMIFLMNMNFQNSNLVGKASIISTQNMETTLSVIPIFSNLTFTDISFSSTGNLISLGHQLIHNLTISDSNFININQGGIKILSSNLENFSLTTNVKLENITTDNIQQNEASFINVQQGGRLEISDSKFTNNYAYQEGAVLSAGTSNTITEIHNSQFMNNSALNGAVFSAKDESTLRVHSSNITNNFAITSGVIHVTANGNFEIYDSFIFNNYANENPVSQLLDTAKISIISNTMIFSNSALSKQEITQEFST